MVLEVRSVCCERESRWDIYGYLDLLVSQETRRARGRVWCEARQKQRKGMRDREGKACVEKDGRGRGEYQAIFEEPGKPGERKNALGLVRALRSTACRHLVAACREKERESQQAVRSGERLSLV